MLLVNVNTKQFIPSAGSNFIQPVESRDQIIYGTRVEVRFQLYNPDGTVFVLNESDTFCCGGDNNFVHTDDLMFYSGHEMCRIIDAAQGIVGVTIDATSDSFADKATSQNTRMYVQLKRHVAGDTLGDTVLQDIVYAQPAVMTTEGAPASSDPEYMTAAATLALLRTAPDYQFSVDGETNWHDQQDIAADRFYRERRNGGEWGPAIELIEGKTGPTGAAAGFGTPSVTVETLPAGSDATASVTASGDNTAKVFNFNFGIPKGADGKNGTDGKAGADGADGVSSYTYVAYASDASGTGFSLTPSNALKFRAEIHTTTAIETPDAGDFIGATWVKYIGDDGTGAGDMTKSVYDTNDDGIVDHAAVADAVGATTAAQVADAVGKAHTHANQATLDKLAEADGKLTYDGAEIGGGSGTVKSVNGQLPDESGNVTVETGGVVDESRLLPDVSGLTQADDGKVMQFKFTSAESEIPVCCNCQALMSGTTDQLVNDSGTGTTLTLGNTLAISDAVPGPFSNNCVSGIGDDGDNYTISISPRVAFSAADDFTLEWWLRPSTNALNGTFLYFCKENGNYDYSWRIYNGAFWQMSSEIIPASEISSLALKANDWNFLVLCRKSGMFRLFINGIRVFSKSWQWAPPETVTFWKFAGGVSGTSNYCGGIRYSRSALYENDFEVPTAPFSVNAGREMVLDFMREATTSKAGAMSAADKAAIAGLTARGIYPELYNVIDPIDFNQLTTQGFYFIGGGADHINYPGTDAKLPGTLIVLRRNNYLTQTFSAVGAVGTSVWERNMYRTDIGNAFTATNWNRLISDADITESKARPGYFKLPGRTIVQWGAASNITADGSTQITFPVAFPNAFLIGNATTVSGNASASGVVVSLTSVTVTGMTLIIKNHPGNSNDINVHWLAIGY